MYRNIIFLTLLSLLALQVKAQSQVATASPDLVPAACQVDISKFEQDAANVRHRHGEQAASKLREKLLPSKEADEVLSQSGQCGQARSLSAKKLV